MQYDELVETVRDIIGEDSPDFWTANEIRRYLNEGQRRFLGEERWPWLWAEGSTTLAAGEDTLELTEGVLYSKQVFFSILRSGDTRKYEPVRVDVSRGFKLRNEWMPNQTGSYPQWFYLTTTSDTSGESDFTSVVRFVPTPNVDCDIEYQYILTAPDLEADPDSPLIPKDYHMALVHYAAGMAWEKELNAEAKAREQFEMYAGIVEQARGEFLVFVDDEPVIMGQEDPTHTMVPRYGDGTWSRLLPDNLGP